LEKFSCKKLIIIDNYFFASHKKSESAFKNLLSAQPQSPPFFMNLHPTVADWPENLPALKIP